MKCAKPILRVTYTLAWYFVKRLGLSNDFACAGSTQQHWPFPGHKAEETGYAYILTHPGMPCIMWEHYFDYGLGGCIKHLVEVRWVVTLDYPANSHHLAWSHWQHPDCASTDVSGTQNDDDDDDGAELGCKLRNLC